MNTWYKILGLVILIGGFAYAFDLIVPPDPHKAILLGIVILLANQFYQLGDTR
jgi:hypothetical protein